MPSWNQPAQPLEPSHQVLLTMPSEPTTNTSMCSVTREIAATSLPGLAIPPETLNQPAHPVVSCHQVISIRSGSFRCLERLSGVSAGSRRFATRRPTVDKWSV